MGKRYGCVVSDPPWPEYGGGGRGAQNHYGLMSVAEIGRLMKREIDGKVANAAHLWMWTTDNYLDEALYIMSAVLGFDFKRTFCWVKVSDCIVGECDAYRDAATRPAYAIASDHVQMGLGQYARGAHELCLFGTSGKAAVPPPANRPPSVIFAPRREHSRKPDECFTEWFEKVSQGPRLEMFCREARPGWDAWGNQVEKFSVGIQEAKEADCKSVTPETPQVQLLPHRPA